MNSTGDPADAAMTQKVKFNIRFTPAHHVDSAKNRLVYLVVKHLWLMEYTGAKNISPSKTALVTNKYQRLQQMLSDDPDTSSLAFPCTGRLPSVCRRSSTGSMHKWASMPPSSLFSCSARTEGRWCVSARCTWTPCDSARDQQAESDIWGHSKHGWKREDMNLVCTVAGVMYHHQLNPSYNVYAC